jgi:hypothetical protein
LENFYSSNSILVLYVPLRVVLSKLRPVANIINFFTAVITPLAAYFSMLLTELRR